MHIKISISKQQLILFDEEDSIKQYSISTAKNGSGERKNSECTPRGEHIIAEKIGQEIAKRSIENGVKDVAFDKGKYKYHGIIKILAEAARAGGLNF